MSNQVISLDFISMRQRRIVVVTIRILLWCAHVTFGINTVVKTPVGNRGNRDSCLENISSLFHTKCCHKTSVAPSPNGNVVFIDVWKRSKVAGCFHLIVRFVFSQLHIGHLPEFLATGTSSPRIDTGNNKTLLSQVLVPVYAPFIEHLL